MESIPLVDHRGSLSEESRLVSEPQVMILDRSGCQQEVHTKERIVPVVVAKRSKRVGSWPLLGQECLEC